MAPRNDPRHFSRPHEGSDTRRGVSGGRIRALEDGAASGAWNMAVDQALMAAARTGLVTVRLYGWNPPCLSLGRNERARGGYDAVQAALRGVDIVRRPTGGRAVYHGDELTYSVVAPAEPWGGLRESYARINRALARGLRALGAPAETARQDAAGRPAPLSGAGGRACFQDPAAGEVLARGRKLVGSAQWRDGDALLQHGSILLTDQQAVVARLRLFRTSPRSGAPGPGTSGARSARSARSGGSRIGATLSGAAPATLAPAGAVGLEELLPRRPAVEELRAALLHGFQEELGRPVEPGDLSRVEREEARRLEARYRDPAWTWRR